MGLFDAFSGRPQRMAAIAQSMGLQRGLEALQGNYGQGRDETRTAYGEAAKPFQSLFDEGGVASGAYGDALGLGGDAGNARARARFQTSPGYEFARDEGLRGAERGFSSGGMLASGNLLDELTKRSVGYADQDWGDYLGRFKPLMDQRTAGATGLGAVGMGLGNQLNTSFMGQGNAANATATGQGQTEGAAYLGGQQASMNGLNALGSILGGVGRLATGPAPATGSFASRLLGLFGGGGAG